MIKIKRFVLLPGRKPSGLRSLGFAFIAVAATFIAATIFGRQSFGQVNSEQVLIYYGNETTEEAAASKNYVVLLAALRNYGGRDGQAIADEIDEDTRLSPAATRAESHALLQSCGRLHANIAVFTNELVASRRFLFCRAGSHDADSLSFADVAAASDNLLNLTPLSRPEYLQAALARVASLFPDRPVNAFLFTHSHGGIGMALMPRVSAEVADFDSATLQRIWELRSSSPDWAALKGTTKLDYWRVLAEVSRTYGMRFALIFRQACESGLDSLAEYRMIPETVGLIVHTAMADLPTGKIDYASLVSDAEAAPDLTRALAGNLTAQGMHVDSKGTLLYWLVPIYLWSLPPMLFFLPLVLWIGWACLAHPRRVKILRRRGDGPTPSRAR